ncbi:MAG TPA: HlyD family efflux transporter periplasmic adaptor subunit [Steroidobacteraceae bacterium]|jgi:membrane fusion protein (multidrug efflux system)|nr:HlyD family efflux transporter periplasmic adaptor subunit [Steroidobacteraceae bacterium]
MNDPVTTPEARTAPAARPANVARRRGFTVLGLVVVVCAVAFGCYWFLYARYFESTDDTYVDGDVVQITSEVPGTVIGLHADDTQFVARGQLLLHLDPADAEVAVRVAEANLGRAVRTVRALFDQGGQLRYEILYREVALRRAEQDYQRRTGLLRDGAVSSEELQHTQDDTTEVRASLAAAREQLGETEARIDGTTVATNPEVLAAAAGVRDAWLQLRRTRITSPVSGVVARRSVQVGQRVAAGTPLMGVVPLDALWVNANFKEVQLRDMRVGQPVTLRVDVYGGKVTYHGKVVGLAAGTGSAFALLPAENASGNWIKIVQRLPVRIQLDPGELRAHPLRIGESVTATVDIRDTSGPLVSGQVRRVPIPSQPSLADDPAVQARIARIIRDNLGEAGSQQRLSANWVYGGR